MEAILLRSVQIWLLQQRFETHIGYDPFGTIFEQLNRVRQQ